MTLDPASWDYMLDPPDEQEHLTACAVWDGGECTCDEIEAGARDENDERNYEESRLKRSK